MTVELFEDVLNIEPVDPNKNYLEDLVGEGKKYKDPAALARSRVEADRHIQRLEAEQKAMRNDLNSRLALEELVTKLSSYKAPELAPQGSEDRNQDTGKNTLTPEDLARIVDERVRSISDTERAKANLNMVKSTLKQEWGNDFVDKMKSKAAELGVGENFLNSLAMDQPQAFLKLMDVGSEQKDKSKPNTSSPLMGNQIDSSKRQAQPQADPNYKGKSYYMKLHRENPSVFWNPKTQLEMNQNSQLDPEKFLAS
jgi:hypothetical protein